MRCPKCGGKNLMVKGEGVFVIRDGDLDKMEWDGAGVEWNEYASTFCVACNQFGLWGDFEEEEES